MMTNVMNMTPIQKMGPSISATRKGCGLGHGGRSEHAVLQSVQLHDSLHGVVFVYIGVMVLFPAEELTMVKSMRNGFRGLLPMACKSFCRVNQGIMMEAIHNMLTLMRNSLNTNLGIAGRLTAKGSENWLVLPHDPLA